MTVSRLRTFIVALVGLATMLAFASTAHGAVHTVSAGESVWAIANAYGTTPAAVARANGLANADVIHSGQRLVIPGPSATSTTGSPSSATGGVVVVRSGDTLGAIALRMGVSVTTLAAANGIADPNLIRTGMRLRSPTSGSAGGTGGYVVRAGDTLWSIASRHGTTPAAIAAANGMRTGDILAVGRRLVVPAGGTSSPAITRPAVVTTSGSGYVVRPGDTLTAIAARTGTTVQTLVRVNHIADPNVIRVGLRLSIARSSTSASTPASAPVTPVTAATAGWGAHPSQDSVRAMIAASSARFGVDPALIRAIAWQESGWWQGARSSAGAIGVMQLMPQTAEWAGPALLGRRIDPTRAADNIDAGTALVAWLLRNATSRDQAVASYYQGLGSVRSRGMYSDTVAYVASVNRHYGRR